MPNVNNYYWTSVTRSGCFTQFASCFHKTAPMFLYGDDYLIKPHRAFPISGGSCIAAMFFESDNFHSKVTSCEKKLYLACEGSAKRLNVPDKNLLVLPSHMVSAIFVCLNVG
jgi:hypothetical protein